MKPLLFARIFERYPNTPPRAITIDLLFEPRDCYIGVYWTRTPRQFTEQWHDADHVQPGEWLGVDVHIVLVPMLPIRVQYRRHRMLGDVRVVPPFTVADALDAVMP